jgi:hypothetical protein
MASERMRWPGRALWGLLVAHAVLGLRLASADEAAFEPVQIPDWVRGVTKMVFITPGEIELAEKVRAEVIHTNLVWPYFPLRRDGGGLPAEDAKRLRAFVEECHKHRMKVVLGLPPFMPVPLVKVHPDWRMHPDDSGAALKLEPRENDLGTRTGCTVGPWGDYLIDILAELVEDYRLDGYSFDGNYHAPLCFCPACKAAYRKDCGQELPKKVDLDNLDYRRYLVWRGQRLEDHYRRMQKRLKGIDRNTVLMPWTVNAGRYGHLLFSPRAMSTRMNLLFDLPMQEWWLDETNLGASVAPAFGLAYLRGIVGARPNASEPYLMSRGNPYTVDSFPQHERITRALMAITHGSLPPQAGWLADRNESLCAVLDAIGRRAQWLTQARPMPWACLLVSEQTRQFHAYKEIAERYLPHVYGIFRAALEEHVPLDLINDWDLSPARLAQYRVVVLANAAALSDSQAEAVRRYVCGGGGLVATCETSLFDELGRPRRDFALADVFGVSYRGHPAGPSKPSWPDGNFAATAEVAYWKDRTAVARLSWGEHAMFRDVRLDALVPPKSAVLRGPLVNVSPPKADAEVAARFALDNQPAAHFPGVVVRTFGKGRVVYFAAGVDAALWSYGYPYQRRLVSRAIQWAAGADFPIKIEAPMCVQATFFEQDDGGARRTVIHLFNGLNSTGGHGLPQADCPLREETVPIHGIKVRFVGQTPGRMHIEPEGIVPPVARAGNDHVAELPPLAIHSMLVVESVKGSGMP